MISGEKMMFRFLFGLAVLFMGLLLSSCGSKKPEKPVIGRQAPNFVYQELDGEMRELKELRGKVVILRFWADWCPYCTVEMPIIERYYQANKDKDFICLAVNVRQSEEIARAFVKKHRLSYPIAMDREGKITQQWEVKGIPINFIINKEGVLKEFIVGAIADERFLAEFLKPYFQ